MFEIEGIGFLMGGFHFIASYFAVEVLRLTYFQYLTLIAVVAAIVSAGVTLITCYTHNNWENRLKMISTSMVDVVAFVFIITAFGVASHRVVQRRYFLSGFLTAVVVHTAVHTVVHTSVHSLCQ